METKLAQMGIQVISQTNNKLILTTTKLIRTLEILQTRGWSLEKLEPMDFIDGLKTIKMDLLYYKK